MLRSKKVKAFLFSIPLLLVLTSPVHAGNYKVIRNDTLYKIANLFETSVSTIMKYNGMSNTSIFPGQALKVPADIYTVKSGDALYKIAARYGISLYSLKRANHEWDARIYPGQKLNLPGIVSQSNTTSRNYVTRGVIPYNYSDFDLLARLITAEADSEPYNAKVGVGAVVVNRVKSSIFPNTLSSVIYQKSSAFYQFTPVENGWIHRPASQSAKNAAYEALHGSDPTQGAIYYFDDSATNKWLWSRPIAIRIGKMVYTY